MSTPRFGVEHAECHACELEPRCHGKKARPVAGMPAIEPNGLMIVGEGPGKNEAIRGEPFVGQAGRVLEDILEAAGMRREQVHLTNATLGQPPPKTSAKGKKDLHGRFPNAIYSCLPRLEAEIAHYRPRVIVTMGKAALVAVTGYTQQRNRHVDNPCDACDPKTRKVGPAVQCAVGDCGWTWTALGRTDEEAKEMWAQEKAALGNQCPQCSAKIKNLRVGMRKCPHCKGRKKRVETVEEFKSENLQLTGKNGIAGALFRAQDLPSRWDQLGVEFIITTIHPAYCLHSSGDTGFGGQFAALAILDHIEKAKRLLERPPNWACNITLTDEADEVAAYFERYPSPCIWDADVETNAKSPWDVDELRCIGFGRPDVEEVLVVDTRRMLNVEVIDPNEGKAEDEPFEPLQYVISVVDEELLAVLCDVLRTQPLGWQNGSYDLLVIARLLGIRPTETIYAADTKIAHHSLRPDEPHTLGHIAAGMTDTLFWKEPKKLKDVEQWESFTQLATYNAKDVRNTSLARERMVGRIHREAK